MWGALYLAADDAGGLDQHRVMRHAHRFRDCRRGGDAGLVALVACRRVGLARVDEHLSGSEHPIV